MGKKTTDIISKDFEKFNIPEEDLPPYEDPYQFTETFKECSVQEYMNVSYSSTTLTLKHSKKEEE